MSPSETQSPEPFVWPVDGWTAVYFDSTIAPAGIARRFHEALESDPVLDAGRFHARVTALGEDLGDLHVYRAGRLDFERGYLLEDATTATLQHSGFEIAPATAEQLIDLAEMRDVG